MEDMYFNEMMRALESLEGHRELEDALSEGKYIVLGTKNATNAAGKCDIAIKDFSAAILRQDPRCFVKGTATLFLDGNCYIYARYNQRRCYEKLGLKLVCGSIGFGLQTPRWFEYGHPAYTAAKDYMKNNYSWDWHVWLENDMGQVWDVVPGSWHTMANLHGKKLSLGGISKPIVIEGLDKDSLEKHGLEYVPALESTQSVLFSVAQRVYSPYFKALQFE